MSGAVRTAVGHAVSPGVAGARLVEPFFGSAHRPRRTGSCALVARAQNPGNGASHAHPAGITTTNHPPLPGTPSLYWLAPDFHRRATVGQPAGETAGARLARGAMLIDSSRFRSRVCRSSRARTSNPRSLAAYAPLLHRVALLGLRRFDDADDEFDSIDDDVEWIPRKKRCRCGGRK